MTIFGIILLCIAVFCIVQSIRSWGTTDKQKAITVVLGLLALILLYLSGVFGLLGARAP